MYGSEFTGTNFWWIVPFVMMIICCLMMRRRRGSRGSMMRGFGACGTGNYPSKGSDTAKAILDKRYASGALSKDEYEEIKKTIVRSTKDTKA